MFGFSHKIGADKYLPTANPPAFISNSKTRIFLLPYAFFFFFAYLGDQGLITGGVESNAFPAGAPRSLCRWLVSIASAEHGSPLSPLMSPCIILSK